MVYNLIEECGEKDTYTHVCVSTYVYFVVCLWGCCLPCGGHSEAFLEGSLDILQQAPLSSALPTPIRCYHLQSEAESHGTSHKGSSSSQEPGPSCRPGATHITALAPHVDSHMRPVPWTPFYQWKNEGTEEPGSFPEVPQLICGGVGISQTRSHFFKAVQGLTADYRVVVVTPGGLHQRLAPGVLPPVPRNCFCHSSYHL